LDELVGVTDVGVRVHVRDRHRHIRRCHVSFSEAGRLGETCGRSYTGPGGYPEAERIATACAYPTPSGAASSPDRARHARPQSYRRVGHTGQAIAYGRYPLCRASAV
jgi:hypothetical protein